MRMQSHELFIVRAETSRMAARRFSIPPSATVNIITRRSKMLQNNSVSPLRNKRDKK